MSDIESSKNVCASRICQPLGEKKLLSSQIPIWVKGNIAQTNRSFRIDETEYSTTQSYNQKKSSNLHSTSLHI